MFQILTYRLFRVSTYVYKKKTTCRAAMAEAKVRLHYYCEFESDGKSLYPPSDVNNFTKIDEFDKGRL